MMISNITPGLIFIIGGLSSIVLRGIIQKIVIILVPILALAQFLSLNTSQSLPVKFLMTDLNLIRLDNLSYTFTLVMILTALAAFIYGLSIVKHNEYASACIYIGSAISVILAGDLITLYIFWELMAVSELKGSE